jgi:hypothetical protein
LGQKKVFTSAYHPQTNEFIERYNRTLSTELRRHLLDEEDWDLRMSMAVFRNNATQHAATGMTSYKAVLGWEVFEFDCGVLQRWNIDAEPEGLARRLAKVHAEFLKKGLKSRDEAARAYNRAVDLTQSDEGSRVLVYDEDGALAQGQKLRQPWLGRYRVQKRLSDVSYILRGKNDARVARVHVNRIRGWTSGAEENTRKPEAGRWPDSRRTLRGILERREKEGAREGAGTSGHGRRTH